MKKNWLKFVLDVVMLIVIALFYSKSAISLAYHEIAGLAVFALFIIHLAFNYKWIVGISKKLFGKGVPVKTKICYIVDALLLLSFILIIVSGALMSKIVFHFGINVPWARTTHYFTSAVVLILLGIHMGLHVPFIGGFLRRLTHMPQLASRIVGITLTAVIAIYGGCAIVSTSFSNWITMPFVTSQFAPQRQIGQEQNGEGRPSGAGDGQVRRGKGENALPDDSAPRNGSGQQNGYGAGAHNEGGDGVTNALETIAKFASISVLFAFITGIIDFLCRRRKTKR